MEIITNEHLSNNIERFHTYLSGFEEKNEEEWQKCECQGDFVMDV